MAGPLLSIQDISELSSLLSDNKALVVLPSSSGNVGQGTMQLGVVDLATYSTYITAAVAARVTTLETTPSQGYFPAPITLTMTGPVTGSVSFDGSSNQSWTSAIANGALSMAMVNGLVSELDTFNNDIIALQTATTASNLLASIITVDGAGSGLDADKLDGLQASSFVQLINANSGNNAMVTLQSAAAASPAPFLQVIGGRNDANTSQAFSGSILLANNYTAGLAPSGQHLGTLAFGAPTTANTLSTLNVSASISAYADGAWSSTVTPTGIRIYVGNTPVAMGTANTTYGQIKAVEINSAGNVTLAGNATVAGGSLFLASDGSRALTSDGSKNLAFNFPVLYNNAGFSLGANGNYWGFGTDGSLTAGGVIKTSGEFQSTFANALRMVSGNYGVMWRQDGASLYLLKTASADQYGAWDSTRPFVLNLAGNSISSDAAWTFSSAANFTSTTTFTGAATFNGVINASGSPTGIFSTWPIATGTIANGGSGGNNGIVLHANNNGGASATSAAALTFIRDGLFGCYFGLDTDNALKIGGWSFGNASYRVVHEGLSTVNLGTVNATAYGGAGVSQSPSNSTLVQRTSAGYINCNYINTTANDIGTGVPTDIAVQTGNDNYLRWQSLANFISTNKFLLSTGIVTGTRIYTGWDSGTASSVSCSGWFRTTGATGLYCSDYAGGVYMTDTTYLRSYNNKAMAASDFVITSDAREKAGIRPLEFRGRLSPKSFTMRKEGTVDFGFIAQEVMVDYPEAVGYIEEADRYQLSYGKLTAILSHQVNAVEDEMAIMKETLAGLTAQLAAATASRSVMTRLKPKVKAWIQWTISRFKRH